MWLRGAPAEYLHMAVGVRFAFGCAVQHIVAAEHEHDISPSAGIRGAILTAVTARHDAKTEMIAALRTATLSMPLVAMCNDGRGRPVVAAKPAWLPWWALPRSDVRWACLCPMSRVCDPRGDSSRIRRSDGEGALHSPG